MSNLEDKTVAELREIAAARDLPGVSQLRKAELVAVLASEHATVDVSSVDGPERHLAYDRFTGPAFTYTLTVDPDPDTVAVKGPAGNVPVNVDGRTVTRAGGHFGRGRWTVTYEPA